MLIPIIVKILYDKFFCVVTYYKNLANVELV